jgi:hypothetical protein
VDADGREFILMKEIVDHRSDGSAVPVDDAYYVDPNGRKTRRMTTKVLSNGKTARQIGSLSRT